MTSFSGADLTVAFGKRVIGELQHISWASQRQKSPVYTLGSAIPALSHVVYVESLGHWSSRYLTETR